MKDKTPEVILPGRCDQKERLSFVRGNKARFLKVMAERSEYEARKELGFNRTDVWTACQDDPEFSEEYDEIHHLKKIQMIEHLHRIGCEGVVRHKFYRDEPVMLNGEIYEERVYDTAASALWAKAMIPELFDRVQKTLNLTAEMTEAQIDELNRGLRAEIEQIRGASGQPARTQPAKGSEEQTPDQL